VRGHANAHTAGEGAALRRIELVRFAVDMSDTELQDHYEILQVSTQADVDTIHRVFRHLAKRFHPDNAETGNAERFSRIMRAFQILSDPAERARYDACYEQHRQARWRVFNQRTAIDDVEADRALRAAILTVLYSARRNDADRPGVGDAQLEHLLGCPELHLKFHLWYLKENGWIQRLENGMLGITAAGVDHVLEFGGPIRQVIQKLTPGETNGGNGSNGSAAYANGTN
jgi:hypothetical protein